MYKHACIHLSLSVRACVRACVRVFICALSSHLITPLHILQLTDVQETCISIEESFHVKREHVPRCI